MFWGGEYRHSSALHCSEDSGSLSPHFCTSWLSVMSGSWMRKQTEYWLCLEMAPHLSVCLLWAESGVCQSPNGPCGPASCVCKSFSWLVCNNYLWLLHSSAHESAWHAHCLWNITLHTFPDLAHPISLQTPVPSVSFTHSSLHLLITAYPKSKLRSPKAFPKPWAVSGQDISMTPLFC